MTVDEIKLCRYYQQIYQIARNLIIVKRPYKLVRKQLMSKFIYADTDNCYYDKSQLSSLYTYQEFKLINRTKIFADTDYQSTQKGYRKVCNTLSTLEYQFAHDVKPNLNSHRSILCTPVGIARPSITLSKTDRMNTNL
jgi:hypothetical protein